MSYALRDLIQASHAQFLSGNPKATFEGVSIDTRTLRPRDIFFAIPGPHHDGHDHLKEAVLKGATGLIIQNLDERLRFDGEQVPDILQVSNSVTALQEWARFLRTQTHAKIIGLTGSNGKTTTKEMIAAILSRQGKTLATRGNLNNHLGLPLTLSQVLPDHRFVVLEMGASRAGDIALLADIARPHIGLITNIGKSHLLGFKSPQGVLQEKRALLDALSVDGVAVINQDDPLLAALANSLSCRKLFFGLGALADVKAENIHEEETHMRFVLNVKGERAPVVLAVPGQFQVMNALAAASVAYAAGATLRDIVAGLAVFQPVAMRMQVLQHPSGTLLINDAYNANPSSVRMSVEGLCKGFAQRARWLVLGDMRELGDATRTEHFELGKWLASQPLEQIFLYGRDTRFIMEGLKSVSGSMPRTERFRKKRLLLTELQHSLASHPVILFKGSRAMKLEEVVNALLPTNSEKMSTH